MRFALTPASRFCWRLTPAFRFWAFLGFVYAALFMLYVFVPEVALLFVPATYHGGVL